MELVEHPEDIGKTGDPGRVWIFKNAKWSVKEVHVKDMGVWPGFGDVDKFTSYKNLTDTARKIKMILHGEVNEWPTNVKPHIPNIKLNCIYSIRHYVNIIYRLFPIVLIKSGKETRRVNENKESTKKFGLKTEVTKYDIEDGSHRAAVFALIGMKKIKCFVGRGLQKY